MQPQPARIEIQFPTMPTAGRFLGIANHVVAIGNHDPNEIESDRQQKALPTSDEPVRRGVRPSALHD